MTLPFGLTSVLHSYKINTRHRILLLQNKNQKIRYLKWKISRGHPLILLNMTPKGIQHYFTILGYENDNFYLYDSLQILYNNTSRITIDDNGKLPGNLTLGTQQLLDRWAQGGNAFFRWYLIESWQ